MEHFNLELADGFATFQCTLAKFFPPEKFLAKAGPLRNVYMVGSHTLLSDEPFSTFDKE